MRKLLVTSAIVSAAVLGVNALAQNLATGPFTAEQAATGRGLYAANCGACHRADLSGAGEAPALAGASFMDAWGDRSTNELYDMVRVSMPYGNGNSLDAPTYAAIVSYMLSANGARPGTSAFTGKETVKLAAIASGKPTAQAAAKPAPTRAAMPTTCRTFWVSSASAPDSSACATTAASVSTRRRPTTRLSPKP